MDNANVVKTCGLARSTTSPSATHYTSTVTICLSEHPHVFRTAILSYLGFEFLKVLLGRG